MAQVTRLVVPLRHHSSSEHRRLLAERVNACVPKDGTEGMTAPMKLMSYAVADLPDATLWEGAMIYVSDEAGGAVPCFSDGTDWRRVTDRVVAS